MKVDSADSDFIWAVACREIAGKQEIISGDNEGHLRSHTVAYSRQGSKFNIEIVATFLDPHCAFLLMDD